MSFIYPNKFTYQSTFNIELAHKCLDIGGSTVALKSQAAK